MALINLNFCKWLFLLALLTSPFLFVVSVNAVATSPVVFEFTINGSSLPPTILDGEEVDLEWELNGPVTNCKILRNGTPIHDIDTTVLPTDGSITDIPPAGQESGYGMSCDGLINTIAIEKKPVITMSLSAATAFINPIKGRLEYLRVNWDTESATRCGNVFWEKDSEPGVQTEGVSGVDYRNKNTPSGYIYWNWDTFPHGGITESTTFFITCYNDDNGTESSESIRVIVLDPAPPEPPIVNVWGDEFATSDPLYGYADASVGFNSLGTEFCEYRAYTEDGVLISNPPGWGVWNRVTSRTFTVRLATTTQFEVSCRRGEVTFGGTTYPAASSTNRHLIRVAAGGDIERADLPPVTVTATATPNPAVKNALTGNAQLVFEFTAEHADYCTFRAYEADGNDEYTISVHVPNLRNNSRVTGNGTRAYSTYLDESTKLEFNCVREYDLNFGTEEEVANGTEIVDLIVEIEESPFPAPAPTLSLYGDVTRIYVDEMISTASERTGLWKSGSQFRSASPSMNNRITFPFRHTYGEQSGTYDIYVRSFDESDGVSDFRFYTEDDGLLDSWTTDNPSAASSNAGWSTVLMRKVGSAINLDDGDDITIECDNPVFGREECHFDWVYFAANPGGVTPVSIDPALGYVDVPLFWFSENTTRCDPVQAKTDSGTPYDWYFNTRVSDSALIRISTTTEFGLNCSRTGDSLTDSSDVTLAIPVSLSLTADILVASGECFDPVANATIDAPDGFIADADPNSPTYRQCVPAVDLAAVSPSPSPGTENNIDGTYNTLDILMTIENLGPGDLPANSGIAYMGRITYMPALALVSEDTAVGSFDGAITAAVPQSPTLTRTFTNVSFGTHEICSRVNLDNSPNNYPEASINFANNEQCTNITLPVPRPPMDITADREVIRAGEVVTLDWTVNVTYELDCTVQGAGGLNESFNTLIVSSTMSNSVNNAASVLLAVAGSGHSDSFTTSPLTSTSEFIFQCTEPITGTSFTEQVTVEVVPAFQEI